MKKIMIMMSAALLRAADSTTNTSGLRWILKVSSVILFHPPIRWQ